MTVFRIGRKLNPDSDKELYAMDSIDINHFMETLYNSKDNSGELGSGTQLVKLNGTPYGIVFSEITIPGAVAQLDYAVGFMLGTSEEQIPNCAIFCHFNICNQDNLSDLIRAVSELKTIEGKESIDVSGIFNIEKTSLRVNLLATYVGRSGGVKLLS